MIRSPPPSPNMWDRYRFYQINGAIAEAEALDAAAATVVATRSDTTTHTTKIGEPEHLSTARSPSASPQPPPTGVSTITDMGATHDDHLVIHVDDVRPRPELVSVPTFGGWGGMERGSPPYVAVEVEIDAEVGDPYHHGEKNQENQMRNQEEECEGNRHPRHVLTDRPTPQKRRSSLPLTSVDGNQHSNTDHVVATTSTYDFRYTLLPMRTPVSAAKRARRMRNNPGRRDHHEEERDIPSTTPSTTHEDDRGATSNTPPPPPFTTKTTTTATIATNTATRTVTTAATTTIASLPPSPNSFPASDSPPVSPPGPSTPTTRRVGAAYPGMVSTPASTSTPTPTRTGRSGRHGLLPHPVCPDSGPLTCSGGRSRRRCRRVRDHSPGMSPILDISEVPEKSVDVPTVEHARTIDEDRGGGGEEEGGTRVPLNRTLFKDNLGGGEEAEWGVGGVEEGPGGDERGRAMTITTTREKSTTAIQDEMRTPILEAMAPRSVLVTPSTLGVAPATTTTTVVPNRKENLVWTWRSLATNGLGHDLDRAKGRADADRCEVDDADDVEEDDGGGAMPTPIVLSTLWVEEESKRKELHRRVGWADLGVGRGDRDHYQQHQPRSGRHSRPAHHPNDAKMDVGCHGPNAGPGYVPCTGTGLLSTWGLCTCQLCHMCGGDVLPTTDGGGAGGKHMDTRSGAQRNTTSHSRETSYGPTTWARADKGLAAGLLGTRVGWGGATALELDVLVARVRALGEEAGRAGLGEAEDRADLTGWRQQYARYL